MTVAFALIFLVNAANQHISSTIIIIDPNIDDINILLPQTIQIQFLKFQITVEFDIALIIFIIAIILSIFVGILINIQQNKPIQMNDNYKHNQSRFEFKPSLVLLVSRNHMHMHGHEIHDHDTQGHNTYTNHADIDSRMLTTSSSTLNRNGTMMSVLIISTAIICCIILTFLACFVNFVQIEYTGGATAELNNPIRYFSFYNLSYKTFNNTDTLLLSRYIVFCYQIFVIFIPLIHICLIGLIWFCPIINIIQYYLVSFIWYLHAWSMIDVMFITAIVADYAYIDIYDMIVNDVIGEYCDTLATVLADCPSVITTVKYGTWFALGAASLLWMIVIYFRHMFACHLKFQCRETSNSQLGYREYINQNQHRK